MDVAIGIEKYAVIKKVISIAHKSKRITKLMHFYDNLSLEESL